jgi:hypothetical protein
MQTRSVVWVGFDGSQTITRINTLAGAGSLLGAALALSHADDLEYWEGTTTVNGAPTPTVGDYAPVRLRARLVFATAGANQVSFLIPAPDRGIFLADGQTVDITNPAVVAFVAVATTSLTDSSGNLVTALISGTLQQ